MTFEEIYTGIQNRVFHPIYLLMGEEPYFIDVIADSIAKNALNETEKEFNQTILYGKDIQAVDIVMAARRFPMMSPYQVIIIKEAQNIKDWEAMSSYVENPMKSTILVICNKYGTIDARKKWVKEVGKIGAVLDSKKLYDNQLPAWIVNYLKTKNKTIEPLAAELLSENLGNDLTKIVHELDKLSIVMGAGHGKITTSDIERNIGISKEYNNFELQKAIVKKDVLKVNKIINVFGKNPKDNPIQATVAVLFGFYYKLMLYYYLPDKSKDAVAKALAVNPFFVQDYVEGAKNYSAGKVVQIIALLREYDMKSKGFGNSSASNLDLLKELTFKIMH